VTADLVWPLDSGALAPGWSPLLLQFAAQEESNRLVRFLAARRAAGATIYPAEPLRALQLTARDGVRVVILGQDPYHGPGQAHGLAFSVADAVPLPPSLRNIFAEIARDLDRAPARNGNLERWARQGVLLLNCVLTVERGEPASHAGRGWETLTDLLLAALAQDAAPKAFLLWGAYAQRKRALLVAGQHLALTANHPSPLSARRGPQPFIGCGHFSSVNRFLAGHQRGEIDWSSED